MMTGNPWSVMCQPRQRAQLLSTSKSGPRVSKERIREVFEELGCRVDENGRVIKL
jgi:hypothetical protein